MQYRLPYNDKAFGKNIKRGRGRKFWEENQYVKKHWGGEEYQVVWNFLHPYFLMMCTFVCSTYEDGFCDPLLCSCVDTQANCTLRGFLSLPAGLPVAVTSLGTHRPSFWGLDPYLLYLVPYIKALNPYLKEGNPILQHSCRCRFHLIRHTRYLIVMLRPLFLYLVPHF